MVIASERAFRRHNCRHMGDALSRCVQLGERETGLEPAQGPLLAMPAIGVVEGCRILEPKPLAA
jgi:hypothetical protein